MEKYKHLILPGEETPFQEIAFHSNVTGITRIAWKEFPFHLAVHHIQKIQDMPPRYVQPHKHNYPEVNIIASTDELLFEIGLGNERYEAAAPSAIWIPAGLVHTANVIKGTGYFVCLILTEHYEAAGASDDA